VSPSGGPQTAEDSSGTLQIGGSPLSAGGSSGSFFSAGGAPTAAASPASTDSAGEDTLPTTAQPLSVERNVAPLGGSKLRPLAAVARLSALPFTGLERPFVVLLALALLASGYVLRRGIRTTV
jgi:hypothetical protein